jgi:nucleoside-diphosphate-sugar epimerase
MIEANIIHAAHKNNVQKLLFLGSSCIYPKLAEQPMTESALLTGTLEETNEPYAVAKIAGIKLVKAITVNKVEIIVLLCLQIYTGLTITSILKTLK